MKTKNSIKLLMLLFLAFSFNSCVEDTDYSTPEVNVKEPDVKVTNTLKSLKDAFSSGVLDFDSLGDNLVTEGYVVSSDAGGNIYKSLYIQDKPENPTTAIQVIVDAADMYTKFEVGRKVYVKLKGLGLSLYKGMPQIGMVNGSKVERISSTDYDKKILRSAEVAKIKPLTLKVSEVKDEHLGMLIKLENMRASIKGQNYTSPSDKYGSDRAFKDCQGKVLKMRNSAYASFKSQSIPDKSGSIVSILSKYNENYQLLIRDTNDVNFTKPYDCDGGSTGGGTYTPVTVTQLNEEFNSVTKSEDINLNGWFVKATSGSRNWIGQEFSSNKYAQISGYNYKGGDEMVSWLVTPGLDLSQATNKNFTFDSKRGFSKSEEFKVLISTDFAGDITNANWTELSGVTLADTSASGYGSSKNSGDIDLSSYSGVVYIAFKYSGNGTDKTGTYQIDNVKFNYTSNSTGGNTGGGNTGGGNTGGSGTTTGSDLFPGSNFDDWNLFNSSLNSYGLKSYATQDSNGKNGSALHIKGKPSGNDYVFTAKVPNNFNASGKTKISFYIKGKVRGKSLSINLYKQEIGKYYKFNVGTISTSEVTIEQASSNSYGGEIDTQGNWVKVTLNIDGITDILNTGGEAKFFAIKVGKGVDWDVLIDDITIE